MFDVKPAAPFNNRHFSLSYYPLNHLAAVDSVPIRVQTVLNSVLWSKQDIAAARLVCQDVQASIQLGWVATDNLSV